MWAMIRMGFHGRLAWRGRTFDAFLEAQKQPASAVATFWETVVVGATNLPVDRVDALVSRLRHDPRHESVRVLREGPLERREFGVWDMAFKFFEGTDGLWPAGRLSDLDAEQAFAHASDLFRSAVVELRAG